MVVRVRHGVMRSLMLDMVDIGETLAVIVPTSSYFDNNNSACIRIDAVDNFVRSIVDKLID